jgi:hypothetical protein
MIPSFHFYSYRSYENKIFLFAKIGLLCHAFTQECITCTLSSSLRGILELRSREEKALCRNFIVEVKLICLNYKRIQEISTNWK